MYILKSEILHLNDTDNLIISTMFPLYSWLRSICSNIYHLLSSTFNRASIFLSLPGSPIEQQPLKADIGHSGNFVKAGPENVSLAQLKMSVLVSPFCFIRLRPRHLLKRVNHQRLILMISLTYVFPPNLSTINHHVMEKSYMSLRGRF